MIITIGNTKGGVGKTTVAINLAIAKALRGRDVWLIDGDRQASSQTAISIRAENNISPMISCSLYSDGKVLRSQVLQQMEKYDDIIIDAGGRDSTSLRAALTISDILLIPFKPKSFDVWALDDISEIIDEAKLINENLICLAFLNCADAKLNSMDNTDAIKAVDQIHNIRFLNNPLVERKAFANASSSGKCVFELTARENKAKDEFLSLLNAIDKKGE